MQIVVTRKVTLANKDKVLDLASLVTAMVTAGGQITVKSFLNPKDTEKYIALETSKGNVCHLFGYVATYKNESSTVQSALTPVAVSPLRMVK